MTRRVYLDNAGAGVPSSQQLEEFSNFLKTNLLANPHSHHATAQQTFAIVENARMRVLAFLGTSHEDYHIVFTHNATHSLKIIAECFRYRHPERAPKMANLKDLSNGRSTLLMLKDSHTSVLGMREYRNYEQCVVTDFEPLQLYLDGNPTAKQSGKNCLFVLTAMSNFCGRKYDLTIIEKLKRALGNHWSVCLDAATWIPCSPLNLSVYKADFVCLSFYKLFGYPSGLGALLIRRTQETLLRKRYFGGGTIDGIVPTKFDVIHKRSVEQRFEDGTLNFHAISALKFGFDDLERLGGMETIEKHCMALTKKLHSYLSTKRHDNGYPVAKIYGRGWDEGGDQGDILNFNLLRDDGSFVGFVETEKMCDLFGIEVRTGCHCNQGACSNYLELDDQTLSGVWEMGKTCHDQVDLVEGRPLGSVRISFGRLNTTEDVSIVEQMIDCCFVNSASSKKNMLNGSVYPESLNHHAGRLDQMFVYPIKSGGSLSPRKWKLSNTGLKWDRNWMVIDGKGLPLTQKRYPALCYIQPDISRDYLVITDRRDTENGLKLPLDVVNPERQPEHSRICISNVEVIDCGQEVSNWLQNSVGLPPGSRLVQLNNSASSSDKSFSNQADYLLLSRASVNFLAEYTGLDCQAVLRRFRANFIIETMNGRPFEEDEFENIYIGSTAFKVTGKCTRCQMICVDQETGQKDPNVLLSLRDIRVGDKMTFGVYLKQESDRPVSTTDIVVGSFVHIERKSRV